MKNRVREFRHLLIVVVSAVLSACVAPSTNVPAVESVAAEIEAKKQREFVLEAFVEQQVRLERIGAPILQSAVSLCKDKRRYTTGAWFWTKGVFPENLQEAAASKYGATDLVQVGLVRDGSPAASAGLKLGDIPVKVNDWAVPTGTGAFKEFIDQKRLKSQWN